MLWEGSGGPLHLRPRQAARGAAGPARARGAPGAAPAGGGAPSRQQPARGPLRAGLPLRRRGRARPGAAVRAGGRGAGPRQQFALETAEHNYRIAERGAAGARPGHPLPHRRGPGRRAHAARPLRRRRSSSSRCARALADDRLEQARTLGQAGRAGLQARRRGARATRRWSRACGCSAAACPAAALPRPGGRCWEVVVQARPHPAAPVLAGAPAPATESEEDLLAVHLYSRLAYGYWFLRGRMAVALGPPARAEHRRALPAHARAGPGLLRALAR